MLRTNLTIVTMLVAALASAQTTTDSAKKAETAAPAETPALVSTAKPATNDSPLVSAAKLSMKARQKGTTRKFDDATIKSSTKLLTTTNVVRELPPVPLVQQSSAQVITIPAATQKPVAPKVVDQPMSDAEAIYDEEAPPPQPANATQKPKP